MGKPKDGGRGGGERIKLPPRPAKPRLGLKFYYKKMTEKMYENLQEKFKNGVFQSLEIYKGFSNFYFNLTIRKKIQRVVESFRNKVIERFSLTVQTEHPN